MCVLFLFLDILFVIVPQARHSFQSDKLFPSSKETCNSKVVQPHTHTHTHTHTGAAQPYTPLPNLKLYPIHAVHAACIVSSPPAPQSPTPAPS